MLRKLVLHTFAKRCITFEGSTTLPLKFKDLTTDADTKNTKGSSRLSMPEFKDIPNIIKNSTNIPVKILKEISFLRKPPIMPELDECCGSGCEDSCVMVIYYSDYKEWKQKRHELMDHLMKDELDGGINKKEFDAIMDYLGIQKQIEEEKKESSINKVVWPPLLKADEWESPPLKSIEKKDVLSKERQIEQALESKVPVDILQFDMLEQKLKAKKKLAASMQ